MISDKIEQLLKQDHRRPGARNKGENQEKGGRPKDTQLKMIVGGDDDMGVAAMRIG